ncbi:MAG: acyl-ACP--UDP-N-acetylglucosamine O-acyltransferase [Lentisphaerae bacterium]|jgi:UDP-N-acetylglucosamine acyltransferase|nr:acyl-ACP--UDP-N-acetylglucosamine O-acyltransferase [Lentisphaerota bacterium]
MSCKIDSRASVAEGVKLGCDVEISPFAVIDSNVEIGDGCKIGPHVFLTGHTHIGKGTVIHTGASIGDEPQDVHYSGAKSFTVIGEGCTIREYVTIHRGTEEDSYTRVGNHVMLMAFSHLGHNCQIGDHVTVANATLLAGRVEVERNAFISAGCMVHQFARIGRLAMVGGGNPITQDVPPFCMLQEKSIQGINAVGLRRANWSAEARDAIRDAVKIYFFEGLNRINALEKIRAEVVPLPEIQEFITFIENTKRGITQGRALKNNSAAGDAAEGEKPQA